MYGYGQMSVKGPVICAAAAASIITAVVALGFWLMPEPVRPPALTDEQVAAEIKRCAIYGMVLDITYNKRFYQCMPPKTLVIKSGG
jgi:hypothetical protein